MPTLHVSDDIPKHDDHRNLGEDDSVQQMGMDMEGSGTEARAELANDVRVATAETEGMYDADVRAAHAFAKFDDEMDSLRDATESLKARTRMDRLDTGMADADDQDQDLGENDKSVLDENKSDLKGDMDAHAHVDTSPDTLKKADQMLASMGAKMTTEKKESKADDHKDKDLGEDDRDEDKDEDKDGDDDEDEDDHRRSRDDDDDADRDDDEMSMLDSAESLIQTGKNDDELATEDLSKDENDLVGRANLEANQWTNMEYSDKMKRVEDHASAEANAESASDSLDVIEQAEIHVKPAENAEAMQVVKDDESDIGEAAENVETNTVKSFVSREDAREESEIDAEEQKEREMEDKARKRMLAEITSHSNGL